uniref:Uncharacterized protein n=1 Tax=Glossina austeni TaxID=7395 RepID=A0A1A9V3J5_GLOAU
MHNQSTTANRRDAMPFLIKIEITASVPHQTETPNNLLRLLLLMRLLLLLILLLLGCSCSVAVMRSTTELKIHGNLMKIILIVMIALVVIAGDEVFRTSSLCSSCNK